MAEGPGTPAEPRLAWGCTLLFALLPGSAVGAVFALNAIALERAGVRWPGWLPAPVSAFASGLLACALVVVILVRPWRVGRRDPDDDDDEP